MSKIGLLGGTFNPIHIGHLRIAEEAREGLGLEQVVFIPAHIPPHKQPEGVIDSSHRLAMTSLAVQDHEAFIVSDIEADRPEKSFSLYTIRHFLRELDKQDELFFILGADAFAEITTWHRWMEVLPMCHFAVLNRPGHPLKKPEDAMPAAFAERYRDLGDGVYQMKEGARLIFLPMTPLDISASDLRLRLREGRSARYLIPDPVLDYIEKNGLYT